MKIFRNIRKDNLKKKDILNYLGYAFGEIVLVVLGILIAVSINNWNEKQKHEKELQNIFSIIKNNLENDIAEINPILEYYKKSESIYDKILGDSLSKEDYLENKQYAFLILGYPEISFDKRGFNLLRNNINKGDNYQDSLVAYVIEFYTKRLLEIEVDDKFRANDFSNNYQYWKNTYDWWATFIKRKESDGFIEYALNNPDYKNRVAMAHFIAYDIYLPEIKLFKERAETIIEAIEKRRHK